MTTEQKLYPIERVLMDADHMAKVATELLSGCASLAIASNAVSDEETAENLAALEQAEGILGEQAHALLLAMHEYRKRAQRFRNSLAAIAAAEQAQQAVPVARDAMALANEVRDAVIAEITKDNIISITGAVIKRAKRIDLSVIVDRYAAQPPAVAVPDEMESVHDTPFMSADTEPEIAYRDGWNACRDAMLAAAPQAAPLSAALADIAAERRRQVEQEGWTPEHDDKYRPYVLSGAAGCYAMHTLAYPAGDPPPAWPFAASWWKPSADTRRNLVKAGALITAEIERIDRAAQKGGA